MRVYCGRGGRGGEIRAEVRERVMSGWCGGDGMKSNVAGIGVEWWGGGQ